MIYATNSQNRQTIIPDTGDTNTDEKIMLETIEHALEGVMFHSYQKDVYSLLCLNGFKRFHEKRVRDESENLDNLKDCYMRKYCKLPVLKTDSSYWERGTRFNSKMERDEIGGAVKDLMQELLNWEEDVLEELLSAKAKAKDKRKYYCEIQDELKEIDFLECVDSVLNKYDYTYEAVTEMDSWIKDKG